MSDITNLYERQAIGAKTVIGKAGKGIKTTQKAVKTAISTPYTNQMGHGTFGSKTTKKDKVKEIFKKRQSGSQKSGLIFPVGRVLSKMRKGRLADRVSKVSGVYLCAVMEYMISEIVENAGNIVREDKKKFVFPRHIYLAIEEDQEMKKYLGNDVIMPTVGRKIHTHPFLKLSSDQRVSQKNFQVVDSNLKDVKDYSSKAKGGKQASHSEGEDDDD